VTWERVTIQDYVFWEAMMFENMCEEQPSRLLGRGTILGGDEVCHLAKLIHRHHDGIESH